MDISFNIELLNSINVPCWKLSYTMLYGPWIDSRGFPQRLGHVKIAIEAMAQSRTSLSFPSHNMEALSIATCKRSPKGIYHISIYIMLYPGSERISHWHCKHPIPVHLKLLEMVFHQFTIDRLSSFTYCCDEMRDSSNHQKNINRGEKI